MKKQFIFISCGQYTESEKLLGRKIAERVRSATGLDAFFAEDVQDLNGLDDNILKALRDCVGFIAVLHPRGNITRPDKPVLTRQRVEDRQLPIIAFKHVAVGK